MKITVVRQTGRPIMTDHVKAFEQDFRDGYDAVLDKCGKDMEAVQQGLKDLDAALDAKYTTIDKLEYPKTNKAVAAFIKEYGAFMISVHGVTGKPVLIIMDEGV